MERPMIATYGTSLSGEDDELEDKVSFTDGTSSSKAPALDDNNNNSSKEPSENDVLCGRGGSINSHPGNERFRILVEKRKRVYLTARFKREKRLIACSIVSEIRALNPFLSRDAKSGLWKDIGDEKARDKTSQALRENAPSIRAEIETEITVQRAEMQRDDDPHLNNTRIPAVHGPAHPAYYNQGWGYPYYVYGHPPPPHPHGAIPPMPVHSYPHPGVMPPPPGHYDPYYHHGYGTTPDPYLHPSTPKTAFEQTSELVTSGAESIKNWTRSSLSFGANGVNTTGSNEGSRSVGQKPIPYKHDDGTKKRRMVKFRDDDSLSAQRIRRVRPCYSPLNVSDSFVDQLDENDLEPHTLETVDHNNSIMSQVAQFLVPTMGSWDLGNIVCGNDTSDTVPFPRSYAGERNSVVDECYQEDDEAIEWEGQEVQLVDDIMVTTLIDDILLNINNNNHQRMTILLRLDFHHWEAAIHGYRNSLAVLHRILVTAKEETRLYMEVDTVVAWIWIIRLVGLASFQPVVRLVEAR
jgi:hypothetical protein